MYWRNFWWLTIVIPLIPYAMILLGLCYYMCLYDPPKKRLQIDQMSETDLSELSARRKRERAKRMDEFSDQDPPSRLGSQLSNY